MWQKSLNIKSNMHDKRTQPLNKVCERAVKVVGRNKWHHFGNTPWFRSIAKITEHYGKEATAES